MKNIIVYTENYEYGGLEKFLFDFVRIVPANVLLLFNHENERIKQFAIDNHLKYKSLKIRNNKNLPRFRIGMLNRIVNSFSLFNIYSDILLNWRFLSKIFKSQRKFDNLLIINGGFPGANSCRVAAIAAKTMGIKNIVFSILSTPYVDPKTKKNSPSPPLPQRLLDSLFNFINRIINNKVISAVDIFHVNCAATKKHLINLGIFPYQKIKTVFTGIKVPDTNKIAKFSRLQNDFITLVKNPGEIWVGMTGLLFWLKGQEYLLYAIKIVLDKGFQNLKCLIVGEGPDYSKLQQLSKYLGIGKNVIFTGKYPYAISDIYRILDVFIFTSLHEGLPYVISEAMAYKLPIISTNVGGIPEQIKDGINGCLVEKADSFALAEKLIWMLENQKKWREMGEDSYKRVKDQFSIEVMGKKMNQLMQ